MPGSTAGLDWRVWVVTLMAVLFFLHWLRVITRMPVKKD
jgi:hypothetical protein